MLKSCLNKRYYVFVFLISLYVFSFSLSRIYKEILNIQKDDITFKEEERLIQIAANNKSEKWFCYLILGQKYFNSNIDRSLYYYSEINKYSYIKNHDTYEKECLLLLRKTSYRDALDLIRKYNIYKSKNINKEIENNFEKILKEIDSDKITKTLFVGGYYNLIKEFESLLNPEEDVLIKSLFYLKDYKSIRKNFILKRKENKSLEYYYSRAFANVNDFKTAFNILKDIKTENSRDNYYKYLYGILSNEIKKFDFEWLKDIDNKYYKAKLIENILKKYKLKDKEKIFLYNIAKEDKFIGVKLYHTLSNTLNIKPPLGYKYSVFNLYNKDIYNKNRKLNANTDIFIIKDSLVKEVASLSPYILLNDIMLTEFKDLDSKINTYFKNELPNQGIRLSYKDYTLPVYYRYPTSFYRYVIKYSKECSLDPLLIWSIIREESLFKYETSNAGANGLMQIMPGTFDWIKNKFTLDMGKDKRENNIKAGVYYISYLLQKYKDFEKPYLYAIMAYNAGPGNLDKWIKKSKGLKTLIRNIPYFETERYLYKVFETYTNYIRLYDKEKKSLD